MEHTELPALINILNLPVRTENVNSNLPIIANFLIFFCVLPVPGNLSLKSPITCNCCNYVNLGKIQGAAAKYIP